MRDVFSDCDCQACQDGLYDPDCQCGYCVMIRGIESRLGRDAAYLALRDNWLMAVNHGNH